MTTIAFRNGIMAADSRVTIHTEEGGSRFFPCDKLFRKKDAIIGLAGESEPGLIFLDWYGTKKPAPAVLVDGEADFTALVLSPRGLFEYGKYCRGERVKGRFYAIGSGSKAALGAMHMGATAVQAVRIACQIDPSSALPVVSMRMR